MSAIFGIHYLDQKPVAELLMERMSAKLSHRGSDATGVWTDKSVGFGHRMLWTTPESLTEKLPNAKNNLVITADARIDNRRELLEKLSLDEKEEISDSEIILASYEKWGTSCPEKLLGDFAFAIWDKRENQLFCARDHFGIKPFYYHSSANLFAFATEIKALLALNEISREVNENAIGDYLVGFFENKSETFYRDILRLPPGHSATVTSSKVIMQQYYELEIRDELKLSSNDEYAEGLREIFLESVSCRMRSAKPIGSMLSGGLDSSSITGTIRHLLQKQNKELLPTFSLIFNSVQECDEQEYINSVLDQGGYKPTFIPGDAHTQLSNMADICQYVDGPVLGQGFTTTLQLYKAAAEAGVRVIFDGHDGDSAVSYGYKYLNELAKAGRWFSLALEAKDLSAVFGMSSWNIFKSYVNAYRWQPFLQKSPILLKADRLKRKVSRHKQSKSWQAVGYSLRKNLLNKDFAEKINFKEKYQYSVSISADQTETERQSQYRLVTAGLQSRALEELDAVTNAFGLETRYPFWDKRLIEYCLSLPGEQKCNRGWNRVVMRRAMNGILPEKVRWRREKTDFMANFVNGTIYRGQDYMKKILIDDSFLIQDYFDKSALSEMHRKISSKVMLDDMETRLSMGFFSSIASMSSWLKYNRN